MQRAIQAQGAIGCRAGAAGSYRAYPCSVCTIRAIDGTAPCARCQSSERTRRSFHVERHPAIQPPPFHAAGRYRACHAGRRKSASLGCKRCHCGQAACQPSELSRRQGSRFAGFRCLQRRQRHAAAASGQQGGGRGTCADPAGPRLVLHGRDGRTLRPQHAAHRQRVPAGARHQGERPDRRRHLEGAAHRHHRPAHALHHHGPGRRRPLHPHSAQDGRQGQAQGAALPIAGGGAGREVSRQPALSGGAQPGQGLQGRHGDRGAQCARHPGSCQGRLGAH